MHLDGPLETAGREARSFAPLPPVGRWTPSDLNYLFHRQQVEHSRSASAPSAAARAVHRELARLYEKAIEQVTGGNIRFAFAPARAATRSVSENPGSRPSRRRSANRRRPVRNLRTLT